MVDIKTLLPELRNLVRELAEDLLARSTSDKQIDTGLREAFQQIEKGGRTAQAFEVWREDYLDQVAVAWVLACVFVRFLEDNHLIDECWLAGEGQRRKLAEDTHELFFRAHPHDTDREYFQHVFREVGKIPAARDLFAEGKTPLWAVGISGDAAMSLLKFWREIDAEAGHLLRSFEVENGDTRFLGDLYQELSERAKKKYALLQTPIFVEEFILDRTLTPAIDEFGLETVRMIDPTCGSGHFLLGGFARLFREWSKPEHTTGNDHTDAQKALDGVWGVDINPFAVAIARFRLVVAAVQACGIKRLKQAPGWTIHLATGDTLLFGTRRDRFGNKVQEQSWLGTQEENWAPEIYACEDRKAIQDILCQQYHVVVGNPPYIIVHDRVLNAAYRRRYLTCHQKYSLAVPFAERFFDLCITNGNGQSGYVGMITANSFMKREFGKKLIEQFFPKIDLTHIIDTSKMGHTLAGHGTPTVILFGRNRMPTQDTVRAVLGIKGEPSTTEDGKPGLVWASIVKHVDVVDTQDDYTSTTDVPRATFNAHPWSIGGGGAAELKEQIDESVSSSLGDVIRDIGFMAISGEDDAFVAPKRILRRNAINHRAFCIGEGLRDWALEANDCIVFPYDDSSTSLDVVRGQGSQKFRRYLWPSQTVLRSRNMFGKNPEEHGLTWFEYMQFIRHRAGAMLSIALAFVATHNHFVLDRGGKVFKQSAPVIMLPADGTEDDHLGLLGLLNSSIACFWMKQTLHDKGGGGIGGGLATELWEHFFEFTGTGLQRFPLPDSRPLKLARQLDALAQEYAAHLPDGVVQPATPAAFQLAKACQEAKSIQGQMIALQEELDWQCYRLYGLLSEDLCYHDDAQSELKLGQRAFEIVMARQIAKGELETTWFERHGSKPLTEIPAHWPEAYRTLVARRIEVIETSKEIGLIEKPDYKRRWNSDPWKEQEQRALRNWLLDQLESRRYWPDPKTSDPPLQSTAQLTDKASSDHEFMEVAALYRGRADFDLGALVADLVTSESVPFLPILCYKPAGLRKREVWERTWGLQREQDDLAKQRSACDERLGNIRARIENSFSNERAVLKSMEEGFCNRCLEVRDRYAPKVTFQDDWNGATMFEKLGYDGVSAAGGLALGELQATSKSVSEVQFALEDKIRKRVSEDAEYNAVRREREAIPDDPEIRVPPKYATADFLKTDYWRLRGKLDVPKERWVSYPHCSTESDPTLLVGWAGWNHLEQATAIINYYDARKREGWDAKRLTPPTPLR